ncbi:hypothetical protein FHX08_004159 [Rhizobium sp. BK529]|uniref:hypothetical protein n=1 Tax=unclassified Rhizobium TaxID=2613769 RepID=UPI00104FE67D|nr:MULTISPECIES: hypothetical protein [unclassified Rhizobium]MBB3593756.1 hypothetical protein [Rhizobium sp. BK529]TCR96026.1 hypothetical protein EV281_11275 [Rhizobium sp. BK418]
MMPVGTTLSRWTMSYFGAALSYLLLAECLLAAGVWTPSHDVAEPGALAIVHAVTLGWLLLLMIGSLLQFAPVLTGSDRPASRFDLIIFTGMLTGPALLMLGFHLISLGSPAAGLIMTAASVTLSLSIAASSVSLSALLWRGRRVHAASPIVLVGIGCLLVTIAFGALFALTVSGLVEAPALIAYGIDAVGFHASFGLGGWMTFAAIGVSYKLLPMFLLSSDMRKAQLIRRWGTLAVALLSAAAIGTALAPDLARAAFLSAAVLFALVVAFYLFEIYATYRARRRPALELNTLGSLPAFAMLGLSVVLLAASLFLHAETRSVSAITYLFVFGWLSGFGLAQLLKIVPFLTWIEAFGPLLGRRPTPKLSSLVNGRRARTWLGLFYLAVVAAAIALYLGSDAGFRMAAAVQTASTLALVIELVLARMLANVGPQIKTAPFHKPALFVAAKNHRGNANGSVP